MACVCFSVVSLAMEGPEEEDEGREEFDLTWPDKPPNVKSRPSLVCGVCSWEIQCGRKDKDMQFLGSWVGGLGGAMAETNVYCCRKGGQGMAAYNRCCAIKAMSKEQRAQHIPYAHTCTLD